MADLTIELEITAAPTIRDLLGGRASRFGRTHPLFSGLHGLKQLELGARDFDFVDLVQLELDSRPIVSDLIGRGSDNQLVQDLLQ